MAALEAPLYGIIPCRGLSPLLPSPTSPHPPLESINLKCSHIYQPITGNPIAVTKF